MEIELGTATTFWRPRLEDGSILVLTLTRPPANLLTSEVLVELAKVLDRTESNPAVKCLVLASGVEGHFIGDTEDAEWERITASESPQSELTPWHRATSRLAAYPLPTIAAIDGLVAGAGLELAVCTDVRIAGADASFEFSWLRRGSIPCAGGTQRLPRIVGKSKTFQLLLAGETLGAEDAAACGLVQEAVTGKAFEEAMVLARKAAASARSQLVALKTAVGGSDVPLAEGLALESRLAASLMSSPTRQAPDEVGAADPPADE